MIAFALYRLAILMTVAFLSAQAAGPREEVGLLCGNLVHREYTPSKNAPDTLLVKDNALRNVSLRLYPVQDGEPCCGSRSPSAETVSGHGGHFKFRKQSAGDYWVVASYKSRDFVTSIQYRPRGSHDVSCSELTYAIEDSGRFGVGRTITVE